MPYHSRGTFSWAPTPSVSDLVLRKLGEDLKKWPNHFYVFICTKLMMPVWVRLMFNMSDVVVYGQPGGEDGNHQFTRLLFLVLFPP